MTRFHQLFSLSDASFGALSESASLESNISILGLPQKRDGIIQRQGSLVSWHCRRLGRISRSSAQAEGLALSNSAEITLYYQILLTELFTGSYRTSFLRESHPVPLPSPFKMPPTIAELPESLPRGETSLSTKCEERSAS